MATAVPAVDEVVPGTVAYELAQIRAVAKGGKQLSRGEFAEQIGITSSQLMGAEKGRKIKDDVWEKIVAAFPQLASLLDGNQPAPEPAATSTEAPDPASEEASESVTIEPSSDETDSLQIIEICDHIDDPHPLPGEDLAESVVIDVQPPTQTTEGQEVTDVVEDTTSQDLPVEAEYDEADDTDVIPEHASSDEIPVTGRVVGSSSRYLEQHNAKRAENRDDRLFSNSEIQTYKRCKRKWYLVWYRKLLLKRGEVIGPRATGTRVHFALEHWYVPDGEERTDPREALEKIIAEDRQLLIEQFGSIDDVPEKKKKDFVNASDLERAMVEGYMEWLEESGADQGLRVIAPEQYVEVAFPVDNAPETNVKIIGKIDVRVQRDTDNAVLFMDHKTLQSLDTTTLHMNEQMLHYHLLEWLSSPDVNQKIDGALYNMLRKVKRTGNAKPPFYAREQKTFNFVELDKYRTQVTGVIKDILRTSGRLDSNVPHQQVAYPNKGPTCAWDCDFFPVCPMFDDGSRAEDFISEYYREGDPLEYYEDKITGANSGS